MKTRILIVFVVFLLHFNYYFAQELLWNHRDSEQKHWTFSFDSPFIVASSNLLQRIDIFDTETGAILHTLLECTAPKFTPHSRFLYTLPRATEYPDVFMIWDTDTWVLHSQREVTTLIPKGKNYLPFIPP